MASGFVLPKNATIGSCDGVAALVHQSDGNVVVYKIGSSVALWSTLTNGIDTAGLAMQGDGNLVLYGPANQVYWQAGTNGFSGAIAAIQGDCNFVVYQGSYAAWASNHLCN
jgi:pseudomonalisin